MASIINIPEGVKVELTKKGQVTSRTQGGNLSIGRVLIQLPEELEVVVGGNVIFVKPNYERPYPPQSWCGKFAQTIRDITRICYSRIERLER